MTSSCKDCASFLTPEEARNAFGKDTVVPVCARFGHMLDKPGVSANRTEKIQQHFAQGCDYATWPKPASMPDTISALVCAPDPEAMMERVNIDPTGGHLTTAPSSCTACKFYVDPRNVKDELGWPFGMCRPKGKLLFNLRQEANGCQFALAGDNADTTTGMLEMPIYNDAYSAVNPVAAYQARKSITTVEPTEYPTDQPVSDYDKSCGIRAWRKIVSQEDSSRSVMMPVFDLEHFEDIKRADVPRTGDSEHPEWYVDHDDFVYTVCANWMGLDKPPMLSGQAGVGKTELARHLAWLFVMPFIRVSIQRSSDIDDIAGHVELTKHGDVNVTEFVLGRVPKAWMSECVLLIDEPNVGPDEIWQFLRPLFDNSKELRMDMDRGQKIARNDFCFPLLAINPAWDAKYVGTNELNYADLSRLTHIYVAMPPESIERDIILQWCMEIEDYVPSTEDLDKVMEIANQIRGLVAQGSLPISWNIREQIKVMQALKFFSLKRAYRLAITDALEPDTGQQITEIVRGYCS